MAKTITIADMKRRSEETGHYFFSKDNMKHSNSIIESRTLHMGKFFITSEKDSDFGDIVYKRKYAVYEFDFDKGKVLEISRTRAFNTKEQASELLHSLRELTDDQKDVVNALNRVEYYSNADKVRVAWRTGNKAELDTQAFEKLSSDEKEKFNRGNEQVLIIPSKTKKPGIER